jgi:hypothetical protein
VPVSRLSRLLKSIREHLYWWLAIILAAVAAVWILLASLSMLLASRLTDIPWFVAVVVYALPLILLALRVGVLRLTEIIEGHQDAPGLDPAFVRKMEEREDLGGQNPMTLVVVSKRAFFRRSGLRTVMHLTNLVCRWVLTSGDLAGIRSIHFADWVMIDKGDRMLFMSSYDGSWESYLSDFVEGAALIGFNAIYSNTEGYPKTTFLLGRGADRRAQLFKQLVRQRSLFTNVFYSAYPGLSVENVIDNAEIRYGLPRANSRRAAARWLRMM